MTDIDGDGRSLSFNPWVLPIPRSITPPVVLHGGFGRPEHALRAWNAGADGIQVASALHYNRVTIPQIKQALAAAGAHVRQEQTT